MFAVSLALGFRPLHGGGHGGLRAVGAGRTCITAGTSCVNTGSGSLCLSADPKGYNISYHKTRGGKAHADFNLVCDNGRWFGDEGSFYISAGQVRTYVFSVGSQGACVAS